MKVLVAEPLGQADLDRLAREHEVDVRVSLSRDDFLAALPDYDALIVRSGVKVDAPAILAAARLKVVGRAGVGVDNIDLEAATGAGIAVVNAPTANTLAAAEHTLALILALARRVAAADASVRRGEWRRADFMGSELGGKTLGIVGLGRVGLAVADRARAFAMTILGNDPIVDPAVAAAHEVQLLALDNVVERSDIVTLHVPLIAQTRGLFDTSRLARMKPGALLINVARGGLVDEVALAQALASGRLGGAAMDVFEHEPVGASPLLDAPNTVLTPHLGASTAEAQDRASLEVVEGVLDVLGGRPATFQVNRLG
ncbi:MAG TPA: hydroxyacid dehydrogenase [Candidatus Limnocylindria bacterium]|nr:hydroxyacid dehydrogenase [Candidatus Limnocylindria bacterium]